MAEATATTQTATTTATEGNNTNATTTTTTAGEKTATTTQETKQQENKFANEEMKKFIQSELDKGLAEERKKYASLKKENEELKKAQMTAEELKKYESEKREQELKDRDAQLTERENRLFAIEAIKEIGLDDGGKQYLELVDFVLADDEETIKKRVTAFKGFGDRFVTARVDKTFKENGRVPNGGQQKSGEETETSIAEKLGKQAAERNQTSNDILKHYYGGK